MSRNRSRYRTVECRIWNDEKFRRLSDDAKLLFLCLLTTPQSLPIPGVIPSGPMGVSEVLGWDSSKRFPQPFGELLREGLAVGNLPARLIWLPNAIKLRPPDNPNVLTGWLKSWGDIPECDLKHSIWLAIQPFAKRFGIPFPQPERNPSPNQEQEQEQEQEIHTGLQTSGPGQRVQSEEPKPPAAKKRSALARHREISERLWGLQDTLRRTHVQGARALKPTEGALARVAARIDAGASEDDAQHVLRVFASRAQADPAQGQWFNGVTNWRADNFDRALGQPDPGENSHNGHGPKPRRDMTEELGGLADLSQLYETWPNRE